MWLRRPALVVMGLSLTGFWRFYYGGMWRWGLYCAVEMLGVVGVGASERVDRLSGVWR